MRCDGCIVRGGERFWPLTLEFWMPDRSMRRCRACLNSILAARQKAYRKGYRLFPCPQCQFKRMRNRYAKMCLSCRRVRSMMSPVV